MVFFRANLTEIKRLYNSDNKIHKNTSPNNTLTTTTTTNSTENENDLGGFTLLASAGAEYPEDVFVAIINSRNFKDVLEEDLQLFTSLIELDVSDNELPFHKFGVLSALQALRISCNHIKSLELPFSAILKLTFSVGLGSL